ncbi:hypothetical protein EI555_017231 [Monodon monoceros]|uniref:Uncharacterized protein n=1 Tax=Monodon monoceros TaxID=40151 RepID=A0A4U1EQ75_MONMO|nr:hypothetical protein EI555_017231 [Monodon monoceros]
MGPGAMMSKEEQAVRNLYMENANQESENTDEKGRDANKGEPFALPLEAGEYCVPRGNRRWFRVRQPILQCRWDMTQRLEEPQARMREENMERVGEEVSRGCCLCRLSPPKTHEPPREYGDLESQACSSDSAALASAFPEPLNPDSTEDQNDLRK